ncbi:MAG: T9SS type A sorting domain-containing protein [Bacteroidetes bacterium]|nr:T9SS type A sorting domain-containing protein [Bacteroidota bacterium]
MKPSVVVKRIRQKAFLTVLFLIHISASAQIVYVDASNTGASPDGSQQNPFKTIQAGLNLAQNLDTVKVAQGTYNENIEFPDNKGIILWGGYQTANFGNRDSQEFVTIINGNNSLPVINIEFSAGSGNNRHFEIDGFTIQGGQRGIHTEDWGNGGFGFIKIANNIIQNNGGLTGSNDYGGGINARFAAEISNNIIRNNSCGKGGGLFLGQHSTDYLFIIENNHIENNEIYSDHGAGAYIAGRKGLIKNNSFIGNAILEGWGWGGGLIIDGGIFDGYSNSIFIELRGNIYAGNFAPSGGAGVFIDEGANVRMFNELIYKNICTGSFRNGALYVDGLRANGNAKTIIENCTIAENIGAEYSYGHAIFVEGGSEVIVKNSIFWDNSSDDNDNDFYVSEDSSLSIDFSIYKSGNMGDGNFTITNSFKADPLFADAENNNFHLKSKSGRWDPHYQAWMYDEVYSPGIDSGHPDSPFDKEPAPNGGRINLGCYGNTEYASKSYANSIGVINSSIAEFSIFPNPAIFNTTIEIITKSDGVLKLEILDSKGRVIEVLHNQNKPAGKYSFVIDSSHIYPGIYFCKLEINQYSYVAKLMIIR